MEAHKVACLLCLVVKVRVFVPFFLLVGFLLLVPHKGLHAVGAVIVNDFMGDDKSQLCLILQLCHKSRIDEYHALWCGEGIDNGAGDGVETQFGTQLGVVLEECVGNASGKEADGVAIDNMAASQHLVDAIGGLEQLLPVAHAPAGVLFGTLYVGVV